MRKIGMKVTFATAIAALSTLAFLSSAGCVQARELSEITASGEIRLGYLIYPPLMNRDPKTNQPSGLVVDAVNAALANTKIKIVWTEVTWSTFAAAIQSDQIDAYVHAFGSPTRALALAFTRSYAFGGNTLVVRKADAEGRFKGFDKYEQFDRPDVTVATILGGTSYEWAKSHFKNAKVIGTQNPDPNAHSLEVLAGRADVAYTEAASAAQFVNAHSDELVNVLRSNPINMAPYSIVLKQNQPALTAFLNTTLDYMEANGIWTELENGKYKGQLEGFYHLHRGFIVAGEGKD